MGKKRLTRKDFINWGKKAGEKNKKKGKAYFRKIGLAGAIKRWNKEII